MNNTTTTIRMDDYTRMIADSAARYMQQTRSAFILSVVRREAERVIKERVETMNQIVPMVLGAEDSKMFLQALEEQYNPPASMYELKELYDSMNIADRY